MKTLDYYLGLPYRLEIVPDTSEPGFVAFYPELPGCITCADDIFKVVENAVDAKKLWLMTAMEDGLEIKEPAAFDYSDFMSNFRIEWLTESWLLLDVTLLHRPKVKPILKFSAFFLF